ncbi:DoxX family protein [Deinococcus radiophilus]|uniref:DoxX family protein n=1 Tax=Deinococcus radiophilus TaxID=32062 RepID=A0A431VZP5_9DEIO|nr:DoxX family protein [Deinococcus radiophilus]RTR28319.1 DoxX family protein [Deinococcus radiophilus]UFA51183.1 DoxX family protein [Deinococcus radiophilus]
MTRARPHRTDTALLLLRLLLGTLLTLRGYQHLLVLGIEGTVAEWRSLGLPYPLLFAPLLSLLELVGGPLLILGMATRPVAVMATLAVLSVLVFTQGEAWLGATSAAELITQVLNPTVQSWLLLVAATLTLAIAGAGHFSVDTQRLPPRREDHPLDAVAETKPVKKRRK